MFQPEMFKGRAIFISGGGSGLGRSMALHFATLGAKIFIVGRREEPLQTVRDEIASRVKTSRARAGAGVPSDVAGA